MLKKIRTLIKLVPGAIISAPVSYILAQGNNFLQTFLIVYFSIWLIIFLVTDIALFFMRQFVRQI
ncbi:hypothetical protein FACI_IFERC00001G0607 [Ferroplasma acidarmanus Fer1]|jgi:hypothetical protein|uniref:Uncharacterized protein n=1 Tax=Ferroplasma acidarmanus Fer1 TaxID=333146 RepID=S0AP90_FERAC|nr:hypothetical protein FACI_IFERC00001G0607 [Ferroplasma acidarmanus Fer1]